MRYMAQSRCNIIQWTMRTLGVRLAPPAFSSHRRKTGAVVLEFLSCSFPFPDLSASQSWEDSLFPNFRLVLWLIQQALCSSLERFKPGLTSGGEPQEQEVVKRSQGTRRHGLDANCLDRSEALFGLAGLPERTGFLLLGAGHFPHGGKGGWLSHSPLSIGLSRQWSYANHISCSLFCRYVRGNGAWQTDEPDRASGSSRVQKKRDVTKKRRIIPGSFELLPFLRRRRCLSHRYSAALSQVRGQPRT